MTWHALVVCVATVTTGCLVMVAVVAGTRLTRTTRRTRRDALVLPHRRHLLTVAAGEDEDRGCVATLAATEGRSAEVVDQAAIALLGKIRGGPADQLTDVLLRHGAVRKALKEMGHRSPVRRAKAAQLLGLTREASATTVLVRALEDPAVEVRTSAAYALGLIGDPAAAAPLLRRVGAPGAAVPAGTAAEALLGMGVGISNALLEALTDEDPHTRHVAAYVSGVGAFVQSVPRLRELLVADADLTVRQSCAEALAFIGGAADVAALARHSGPAEPLPLRRVCATALGDLGHPAAASALEALVDDPDPRLAELAAGALLRLSPGLRQWLVERAAIEEPDSRRGSPVGAALTVARLQGVLP